MLLWIAIAYLVLLSATLTFLAGAAIVNETWDRDAERTLRLLALFPHLRELSVGRITAGAGE